MSNENLNDAMDERQSQLATVLIGVLIVVAGFLIYTVFNNQTALENPDDLNVTNEPTPTVVMTDEENQTSETPQGGSTYTVKEGDTLWSIAQEAYDDGYKWLEIADANNISVTNTQLEIGQELTLPALGGPEEPTPTEAPAEPTATPTPEEPTPTPTPQSTDESTTDSTTDESVTLPTMYTVQHGDTLWSIAERFYGDGNNWKVIFDYKENDLSMYTSITTGHQYPIIHAGNVLVIPQADNAA